MRSATGLLFSLGMACTDPSPGGAPHVVETRPGTPAAVPSPPATLDTVPPSATSRRIEADLVALAGPGSGGRASGSDGQRRAARYIRDRVKAAGWHPAGEDGFFARFPFHPEGRAPSELENIVAILPGSATKETIVLSAHYDAVGEPGSAGMWPGADDNGSGVAALLAVADALPRRQPLKHTVALAFFSAEEHGLLGSDAWTSKPTLPAGHGVWFNINIDMIGRGPRGRLLWATSDHPLGEELANAVQNEALAEGFDALGSAAHVWRQSDHLSFVENLDVPAVFLFAGVHSDMHEQTDTVDQVDLEKVERVSSVVMGVVRALDASVAGAERDTARRADPKPGR